MSYTPAMDKIEYDRKVEQMTLCGKNRGTHDYIPISWEKDAKTERVTRFICRTCLRQISMETLEKNFEEIKSP